MYINTQKNKKELAINNGFSFPCYSSSEAAEYVSHSTFLDSEKKENIFSIFQKNQIKNFIFASYYFSF